MKQIAILFILVIGLTSGKKPDVQLGSIELFNKQVGIKVPTSFDILGENEFKKYFSKEMEPKLVYANSDNEIRIAFGAESVSSKESGIPILKVRFESALKKMHPKARWISDGVEIIDGNKVGFIEYLNKSPEKFYELLFFTSFKGQLLYCTIHSPKKGHRPWKKIAHEIMESLTIKN